MRKPSSFLAALTATLVALTTAPIAQGAPAPAAPVVTPLTMNTDAAFDALNRAFLVSDGNRRYYKESLGKTEKDYFWRQALDIQAAEDVYDSTRRPETRDLIGRLLDTFLQQNQGSGGLYDWNWNEYNDDLLWAGLAFARGYKITGNRTYLSQAQYAFTRIYDRGWDSALGGGVWWSVEKQEKSALSNSPAVILGVLIFESTGDRAYLDRARAIYDWTWGRLLDRSTGGVHEHIKANGTVSSGQTVYSAGAFVGAAQALYRNTGQRSIFDDAKRTTDWVIRERTVNGIMTNGTREGTWQSEFSRGMGEFVRENNLWDQYYDFMKRNADAAWNARRTDLLLTWNRWDAQTPRDDTRAVEAIGSVIMQAVTPASKPSGSTIVSNWNGKCVDVSGGTFTDGQRTVMWDCNGGANQKWEFTGSELRTQNNKCLDVKGGSTVNGAVIQLWSCNSTVAQRFALSATGDLVNLHSNKCVDISGWEPNNGAVLVLWDCTGAANQKWHRN
ncbi:glycoside hydrolase family 76 protein [Kibdelosporangium aridum]|uniref:Predicted alpha-1,6-mannanase, GH76 family n=1 Tax=Kibdelosporangium aridum TaxID=2030 RepID=A0A1Y5Y8K0_KIBAR|nr:glycoside hydrolase family 76 protein [Kibdelosporangium aridum]SMD26009.1 Predicted alpha-1,6-mannanase, GH76 family [Kibdelosporangium aridum]